MKKRYIETMLLSCLAASPDGLSAPELRNRLRVKISQPTLSRRLAALRARGLVVKTGKARATRYLLGGGRMRLVELRNQALHQQAARKLATRPDLKQAALRRLERLRQMNPASAIHLERWRELLAGDELELLRTMTESGRQADTLRKASPFPALLTEAERKRILDQFAANPPR